MALKRQGDMSQINAWITDRFPAVMGVVKQSLVEAGFSVKIEVDNDNVSISMSKNDKTGFLDIRLILLGIASIDGHFDQQLSNQLYEMNKIYHTIGERIEVVKALFSDNADDRLCELSRDLDTKFVIMRPI